MGFESFYASMSIPWFTMVVGIAVAFYFLFIRETRVSKMLKNIPGPAKLPFFGNALDLNVSNASLIPLLDDWNKKYGKRFVFWIGPFIPQVTIADCRDVECYWSTCLSSFSERNIRLGAQLHKGFYVAMLFHIPYFVLARPSYLEKVLSSSVHINKSRDYNMLEAWLGTGLLISRAGKWSQRRKMLTPTFHFRILDDFLDVFNDQTKTLTQILRSEFGDGKVFNIFPYVTRCALDIISETAFGRKINAQEQRDTEYVKAIYRISELIQYRQVRPWLHSDFIWYNLSSFGREEKRCLKILHGFTDEVIADKKAELKKRNERGEMAKANVNPDEDLYMSGKIRLAFLDLLLEGQESNHLTDTDIREETDTFMFEGHDTTAANANWTIFLLGCYPEYQAKVHEELDSIFGDDRERPITSQDMTQMKYLECCLKESLRIYPSVPFIGRAIESDCQLDDEVTMPAGSTAFIIPYQLHRDPEVFPEPEVFLPDRFFPESIKGRHPFAYVPFSAGPRNCIGQKFAMMEEKVMMAQFFRNFRVEAAERREDLILLAELIMRPQNGLHIKIFPRD